MIDDFCDAGGEFGFEFGGRTVWPPERPCLREFLRELALPGFGFGAGGFLGVLTVCGFSGFGCLV